MAADFAGCMFFVVVVLVRLALRRAIYAICCARDDADGNHANRPGQPGRAPLPPMHPALVTMLPWLCLVQVLQGATHVPLLMVYGHFEEIDGSNRKLYAYAAAALVGPAVLGALADVKSARMVVMGTVVWQSAMLCALAASPVDASWTWLSWLCTCLAAGNASAQIAMVTRVLPTGGAAYFPLALLPVSWLVGVSLGEWATPYVLDGGPTSVFGLQGYEFVAALAMCYTAIGLRVRLPTDFPQRPLRREQPHIDCCACLCSRGCPPWCAACGLEGRAGARAYRRVDVEMAPVGAGADEARQQGGQGAGEQPRAADGEPVAQVVGDDSAVRSPRPAVVAGAVAAFVCFSAWGECFQYEVAPALSRDEGSAQVLHAIVTAITLVACTYGVCKLLTASVQPHKVLRYVAFLPLPLLLGLGAAVVLTPASADDGILGVAFTMAVVGSVATTAVAGPAMQLVINSAPLHRVGLVSGLALGLAAAVPKLIPMRAGEGLGTMYSALVVMLVAGAALTYALPKSLAVSRLGPMDHEVAHRLATAPHDDGGAGAERVAASDGDDDDGVELAAIANDARFGRHTPPVSGEGAGAAADPPAQSDGADPPAPAADAGTSHKPRPTRPQAGASASQALI